MEKEYLEKGKSMIKGLSGTTYISIVGLYGKCVNKNCDRSFNHMRNACQEADVIGVFRNGILLSIKCIYCRADVIFTAKKEDLCRPVKT